MDAKISGLEKGADAFLAKPFEQKELLIRLEKLLELRKKLQARYAVLPGNRDTGKQEIKMHPFLVNFYDLLEKELGNPDLDMNQICRSLGMSRSQVFKKLKALTGKSASVLVRSFRLSKAKELLTQGELNVSEVAYEVGFTTPNYFTRAFQDEFGVSPSQFSKQK